MHQSESKNEEEMVCASSVQAGRERERETVRLNPMMIIYEYGTLYE